MSFEKGDLLTVSIIAMALLAGVSFATHGANEAALSEIIRWTARFSVTVFLLAFVARPLRQLWSSRFSGWLLRNRRYLGVSFAIGHFTHLAAFGGIAAGSDAFRNDLDATTLLGGGYCYLLIALMLLTSTDRTAAWLSRKNWRRLHSHGMYVIWLIFALSYIPRAAIEDPIFIPAALALLLGLGTRATAHFKASASERPAATA